MAHVSCFEGGNERGHVPTMDSRTMWLTRRTPSCGIVCCTNKYLHSRHDIANGTSIKVDVFVALI